MGNNSSIRITDELLAAFLDGNTSREETQAVLNAAATDPSLRELLEISMSVDEDLALEAGDTEVLPISALAALSDGGCRCVPECEAHILGALGIPYDIDSLAVDGENEGWLKSGGTELHNIGRHIEKKGIAVRRQFKNSFEDIRSELDRGNKLIAVVDGGELYCDRPGEMIEDEIIGQIPDHAVVVDSYDADQKTITIYDPVDGRIHAVTEGRFSDAWADSRNYLVIIYPEMKTYIPKPIDLSDVELTEDLNELREAIAENAHEIWAENRQSQGWTYGPERNDALKQTPDMVPYSQLPESEKLYDREMAMKTIKLLKKLGYDLIKREDTELYNVLKKRIEESDHEYRCRRCHNVIYRHQVFCDNCGLELNMDWNEK